MFSLQDGHPVIDSTAYNQRRKEKTTNHPAPPWGDACQEMSELATDIKEFQLHDGDTGSADVQVALLSWRINELTEHLNVHKKDFSSRRGLLMLVAQRRKLLDYLASTDNERYQKVISALNLRR